MIARAGVIHGDNEMAETVAMIEAMAMAMAMAAGMAVAMAMSAVGNC